MKPSRTLAPLARKTSFFLITILLLASNSEGEKGVEPSNSSCTSHCETCPVVCLPPLPPKHHHSPPESYYISPPARPAPTQPSSGNGAAAQPPHNTPVEPDMVQQNFSNPYYYFYTSKAAARSIHLIQGFNIFVMFMFLLYGIKPFDFY